jgi:hypothetical protein
MSSQHHHIEIRTMADDHHSTLEGTTEALRVPSDLWSMDAPARCLLDYAVYELNGQRMIARIAPTRLDDCEPGERVLIRAEALPGPNEGWRLCEVVAIEERDWEK